MNDKFLKPYNPAETEDRIYKKWEDSGYFNPDKLPSDESDRFNEPFSMVLPPPNVTGVLHMGSAMMLAIEDIMVRYARMTGKKTLWIPGTDHAAIATQSKVEKEIKKNEGKSRHDLGREELLQRINKFAKESHDTIVTQIRKMGSSIDWSREAFTLDEKRNIAVKTAFKKMYDDGLIYRGYRVVNWDPKGQTTISDDEIVYESRKATLYTFKYSKDIPISISTTRPETKLGDTAIAVHPDDTRYKQYVGKEYVTEFAGEKITLKVIADQEVDPEFGTGALGVTPAHSITDWEIAQRHNLPLKQVINEYGKMTAGSPLILDKKTTDAREAVVEWLKSENLIEKEEVIDQNISTAERTGGIIEPLPKLQWFIDVNKKVKTKNGDMKSLKEMMVEAVDISDSGDKNKIQVIPERFARVYENWVKNLRDWCISRQIWYGHRIPVWYCFECNKKAFEDLYYDKSSGMTGHGTAFVRIGGELDFAHIIRQIDECSMILPNNIKPAVVGNLQDSGCPICNSKNLIQDEDTLDTWFSSGLWTFSTLGWPDSDSVDLKKFHPTTILETGSDILFFWVARMILMSTYLLGEIPFKTVYLHGIVRDGQGRKISKSLGNNIDPLDMISTFGADAIRMSLIVGVGPGNDSKVGQDKIKAYKLFANKIWNATRYVLTSIKDSGVDLNNSVELTDEHKKYISDLEIVIKDITSDMNNFRYYMAGEKLYQYFWHEFADKIIEATKSAVNGDDSVSKKSAQYTLLYILATLIKALHPFMPFITEEIWSELPIKDKKMLMIEMWPK